MAVISSNGTGGGLASSTSTWAGGVVPVEGDKVIIVAGDTVTVDGTFTWGDDSVTTTIPNAAVNVSGTLKASRTVNSSLTGKGLILLNVGATLDYGQVGDEIPNGITAELILNKAVTPAYRTGLANVAPTTGTHDFWIYFAGGSTRVRNGFLASQANAAQNQIVLATAAHNWQIGDDVLLFPTTNGSTNDEREWRTVASVSGATITLNANLTYAHKAGSPACNMNSNVVVRSHSAVSGQTATTSISFGNSQGRVQRLSIVNALFKDLGATGVNQPMIGGGGTINSTAALTSSKVIKDSAFYTRISGFAGTILGLHLNLAQTFNLENCAIYGCLLYVGSGLARYGMKDCCMCQGGSSSMLPNSHGKSAIFTNCWFGSNTASSPGGSPGAGVIGPTFINCTFAGRWTSMTGGAVYENCDIGYTYGFKSQFGGGDAFLRLQGITGYQDAVIIRNSLINPDCEVPCATTQIADNTDYLSFTIENKNQNKSQQEIWTATGKLLRDNTTTYRSASSISINPYRLNSDTTRTLSIPCANGKSIRIVGYVKKSHATNVSATVAITGLGITPASFTKANDTNWEQYDLSATNSSGNDGTFTLTYTANSSSGTTNVVYFDGVPDSPFVTACRHYGFNFDEANPTRVVNPYTSASEVTAAAYTGVTITSGSKRVSFSAGTADTFQKVYDYSQAWGCLNIAQEMPWSRAGALLSLTSGWTVVDPTITGCTWGGGTVEFSSTGTKTGSFDTTTLKFTMSGNYDMAAATFAGNITLINSSGGAVTVALPAGVSYTNTGPNITVTSPQVYQSVTINGVQPGSRVQIYDLTNSIQLFNGTSGYSWTDSVAAASPRSIRVRVSKVSGTTAYQFIEVNIGSCGITDSDKSISYMVDQKADTTYNRNAMDGSTVTGITFTDAATDLVNCNIAGGSVQWKSIYAAFVYWESTAPGIANDFTYIQAPDPANYILSSMKIRNISSTDLMVTGGYGVDAITGFSKDIIDTAGSTGNIFLAPDHVTPYQTTGTYAITGDISTVLAAIPSAATNANAVRINLASELTTITDIESKVDTLVTGVNISKVNNTTVIGSGTSGDKWRPA